MKKPTFLISMIFIFVTEIVVLIFFAAKDTEYVQDAVLVNEAVQSVQNNWNTIKSHKNQISLDYVVIGTDENVLFKTRSWLSGSINKAIKHRDTMLDIKVNNQIVGKIIIYNDSAKIFSTHKKSIIIILSVAMFVQCIFCIGYFLYLNHTIIKPFHKLKGFAERIAGGNLDIPLKMDRQNLFGAFTESFDIMRSELQKARRAEAKANAEKKELVAKLSHDIKTPVASIKAASEVGSALAYDEKTRDNYIQIIHKADQINTLVTNLFTASLEEIGKLSVAPTDIESKELKTLLENSDYLHHTTIPNIPDCILYIDKLRLQQVFDNIFANSYKYAGTNIDVTVQKDGDYLLVGIEDYGGGVNTEELPLLKNKFERGSNVKDKEGAGLGLYISDYFMKEMQGELIIENGHNGLKVTVMIALSGTV